MAAAAARPGAALLRAGRGHLGGTGRAPAAARQADLVAAIAAGRQEGAQASLVALAARTAHSGV